MAYNQFAYYYDSLMDEDFYEEYKNFILTHVKDPHDILELGCGTGTLSIELAKLGKKVFATDLSEEMIEIAAYKAEEEEVELGLDVLNMLNFHFHEAFDLVLCATDGVNYLSSIEEAKQMFDAAYLALRKSGTLLFDVHSMHKVNVTFLDYHEHEEDKDFIFDWHVRKIDEGKIEHLVYIHDEGNEDVDERHIQLTFPVETYVEALRLAGFEDIQYYSNFHEYDEQDDRVIFVVKK